MSRTLSGSATGRTAHGEYERSREPAVAASTHGSPAEPCSTAGVFADKLVLALRRPWLTRTHVQTYMRGFAQSTLTDRLGRRHRGARYLRSDVHASPSVPDSYLALKRLLTELQLEMAQLASAPHTIATPQSGNVGGIIEPSGPPARV
jgi:hypothetical protein